MRGCGKGREQRRWYFLRRSAVTLAALVLGVCTSASAFDIPTGSEDWKLRWDNTIRFTLMDRLLSKDSALIADPNGDDGDRNFGPGIVSNRLDLLSEGDLIYKKDYGIRVSGAFWYDQRYDNFDGNSVATSNHLENGRQAIGISGYAQRYFGGPSGELLDAFGFGKINAGNVPIYLKMGRHTEYWGEALLNAFHGISYGQAPLDLAKATSQPGVEVKEVFRPTNNFSGVAQISNNFSFAWQYFMEWERDLAPEAGTYLSASDLNLKGSESMILGPGLLATHGRDITPDQFRDFGFMAKYAPSALNPYSGTLGFYYRNFSDKLPQAIVNLGDMTYHFVYPSNISVAGISYAQQIFGISVAAEASYRHDMPLASSAAFITSASQLPERGETLGARGDTFHALINFLGLLKRTSLWDAGSWNVEMAYSRWLSVNQGDAYFKGSDSYTGFDRVTDDNAVIAANFSPQWMQVFPGVDISLPITGSVGLWGTSAVANGGGQADGSWGIGLQFDIFTKYKVNINYVDFFGPISSDPITGAYTSVGGSGPLRDRDFITLTFKTSF
ncbi:MAG: DUF1302 family protein [Syntrophobacter sp.]